MSIGSKLLVKISVIINNYNYGAFIAEAIASAVQQEYPRKEVIVVDDGSTDGSAAIIRSIGEQITAIYKSNGGQASAMNAGFAASSGDIVIFLDADDYLLPGALRAVANAWEPGLAKANWRMITVGRDGAPTGTLCPGRELPLADGDWRTPVIERDESASPPTSGNAFSRLSLDRLLPIPEKQFRVRADGYLLRGVVFQGPVKALSGEWSCYRVHGANRCAGTNAVEAEGLRQLRERVGFSETYRSLVIKWARESGVVLADDFEPLAYDALKCRLISLVFDAETHPVERDTRRKLLGLVVRSLCRHPRLGLKAKTTKAVACAAFAYVPSVVRNRVFPALARN